MNSIISLFEAHVQKRPEKIALSFCCEQLTYKQLNNKANQLSQQLKQSGVGPGSFVPLYLPRSIDMVIAVLAVLKAGAAYIPLADDYPQKLIQHILESTEASILVTHKKFEEIFYNQLLQIICLDQELIKLNDESADNPAHTISPNDSAYICYTSGTTNAPKGVIISHGALLTTYESWKVIYNLSPAFNHLQMATFSFDVFTGDLVRTLCSGGKLVICPRNTLLKPERLYALMKTEKINCAEFVPTTLRRLVRYLEQENKKLDFVNLIICGSDTWTIGEYKQFKKISGPKTRLINSYGTTETTIDNTYFESEDPENISLTDEHHVPLGNPLPHVELYLLDEKFNPITEGALGEIYIGGPSLAIGYYKLPKQTEDAFITHPHYPHKKIYKTNDIARLHPGGHIELLGRADNQIKIHGNRIQPSAIEFILNKHPQIKESLVSTKDSPHSDKKHLFALIVLKNTSTPTHQELFTFLKEHLPAYAIPRTFEVVEKLPTCLNGKLIRKATHDTMLTKKRDFHINSMAD